MKKIMAFVFCAVSVSGIMARADLDIVFVDSFEAMRKCKDGELASKKIDMDRDSISKELQEKAQEIAKEQGDLESKKATLKPELVAKRQRDIDRKKREFEDLVRDKEEEMKLVMQQHTEHVAMKVEEGIVAVAKDKNVDAVIDKMTGRVLYTKDNNKGDITADTIKYVDAKMTAPENKKTATV